jgi:hypothetical protein
MSSNDKVKSATTFQKLDEQALDAVVGGQSLLLNESMLADEQQTDLLQGAVLDLEAKGVGITHDHLPQGVGITHDHLPQGVGITNDHLPQGVGITNDHLPQGVGVTHDHMPSAPDGNAGGFDMPAAPGGGMGGFELPGAPGADAGNPTIGDMLGEKGGMVSSGTGDYKDPYKGEDGAKKWDEVGGWKETDTALLYKSEGMQRGDPGVAIWTDDDDPDTGKKVAVFLSDEDLKDIERKAFEELNKPSGDKSGGDGEKAPTKEGGKETTTDGEGASIPGDVLKDVLDRKLGGSNPLVRTIDENQTYQTQPTTTEEFERMFGADAPIDTRGDGTSADMGRGAALTPENLHNPQINPSDRG